MNMNNNMMGNNNFNNNMNSLMNNMMNMNNILKNKINPMMNMNMMNMNMNQFSDISNDIDVIFRNNDGVPIHVHCKSDEKVSEIIKRYRNKALDFEDNRKFIFNAKDLNPSLTVSETGLLNNANIFVVTTKKNNYDTNNIKY